MKKLFEEAEVGAMTKIWERRGGVTTGAGSICGRTGGILCGW